LRESLLERAPLEVASLLLAGYHSARAATTRLFVREAISIPEDAYIARQALHLTVSPTFIAKVLKQARQQGLSLITAHSHPFSNYPEFSEVDDAGEQRLMPTFFRRAPNRPHGSIVVGRAGGAARVWRTEHECVTAEQIVDV